LPTNRDNDVTCRVFRVDIVEDAVSQELVSVGRTRSLFVELSELILALVELLMVSLNDEQQLCVGVERFKEYDLILCSTTSQVMEIQPFDQLLNCNQPGQQPSI